MIKSNLTTGALRQAIFNSDEFKKLQEELRLAEEKLKTVDRLHELLADAKHRLALFEKVQWRLDQVESLLELSCKKECDLLSPPSKDAEPALKFAFVLFTGDRRKEFVELLENAEGDLIQEFLDI